MDYTEHESPLVRYYDLFSPGIEGDVAFYQEEAQRAGDPVLELACGTGRVLIPLAEAGATITGLDRSPAMLDAARRKIARLPEAAQRRITLIEGDMTTFTLDQRFRCILIPYSSLYLLSTPEAQRACLERIYDHLEPGGRLIFSVFDPRHDIIAAHTGILGAAVSRFREFDDPQTGQHVVVYDARQYNPAEQKIRQEWTFETLDAQGRMVAREYTSLVLRYAFRWEVRYLLELCGFEVEALYGDFHRGPFRHGNHQVWIARRSGSAHGGTQ